MDMDPKIAIIFFIVLLVLGLIVFLADAIIFIRWMLYRWELYRCEEAMARMAPPAPGSPYPQGMSPGAAGEGVPSQAFSGLPSVPAMAPEPIDPATTGADVAPGEMELGTDGPSGGIEPSISPDLNEASPAEPADPAVGSLPDHEGPIDSPASALTGQDSGAVAGGQSASEGPWPYRATVPEPDVEQPGFPRRPFAKRWSLVDAFVAFQFVFIVSQVVITAALLPVIFSARTGVAGAGSVMSTPPAAIITCIGLFFMNGLFVGATAFYVHRYGLTLAKIGLATPSLNQIGLGLGLGVALFVFASGTEIGLTNSLPHLLPKAVMDGLTAFNNAVTAGGMFNGIRLLQIKIFFALAGAVAAPIGEEVFFRGLLYNALKRRLNVPAGIVISGLIFALVHFGPLSMLIIFPMGMILAYVYEKTGSLWVTICMHGVNNGMAFALTMLFPHLGEAPKQPPTPGAPRAAPVRHARREASDITDFWATRPRARSRCAESKVAADA